MSGVASAVGTAAGQAYDPVGALLLGVGASVPLAAATLLLARRMAVERAAVGVAVLGVLAGLGGVAGALVGQGTGAALAAGQTAVHAGVQLAVGTLVGRRILARATASGPSRALAYAVAGLPVGHALVALAVLLPDSGLRTALSAGGPLGLVAWGLAGVLLAVAPGVVGVWLHRLVRWLA